MNNEYLLSLVVGRWSFRAGVDGGRRSGRRNAADWRIRLVSVQLAGRRATDVITGSTIHHAKHGLNGHNGNDLHNGWGFVGLGWFLVGF